MCEIVQTLHFEVNHEEEQDKLAPIESSLEPIEEITPVELEVPVAFVHALASIATL